MPAITNFQFEQQVSGLTKFIQTHTRGLQSISQGSSDSVTGTYVFSRGSGKYTSQIQILILYNQNYSSPVMHFRISVLDQESHKSITPQVLVEESTSFEDIESWSSVTTESEIHQVIKLRPEFQIALKDVPRYGIWWFIHPCDTTELLQNSPADEFLVNWFSIYGNWLL